MFLCLILATLIVLNDIFFMLCYGVFFMYALYCLRCGPNSDNRFIKYNSITITKSRALGEIKTS